MKLQKQNLDKKVGTTGEIKEVKLCQPEQGAETRLFDINEEFRSLFREMTTAFAFHRMIWDEEGKPSDYIFLEVNKKFEELTGLDFGELVGKRVREVLPGIEQKWIDIYGEVAGTGKPAEFENYSRELDRYYEVNAYCPKLGYFAVTFNDITHKRKRTLKINELKSFYEGILKTVNEGIAVTDQNDLVYFVNASMGKITGMDAIQLTGKHILTDFPDKVFGELLPSYIKAKDSRNPVQCEGQGLMPDGRKLILSGWLMPLERNGSYDGMICSISDITERKKAELSVRESEQRFKALTGSAPNVIFSTNRELKVTYINKTIDNSPAGNVNGMNIYDLTPTEEIPRVKKHIARLFRTKREVQYEIASKNEFGDYWLDVRAAPILHGKEIEGLIFILTDITKRKKAEERLVENEERFRGLLDKSPVAMIVGDPKGNMLYLNERFIKTFGYTINDVPDVNRWWNRAFPDRGYREKIIKEWVEENEKVKRGEPTREFSESYVTCKDGSIRYIRALWSIFDDNVIVMLNDLTESKKLEHEIIRQKQEIEIQNEKLLEAKLKAEESDLLKSAFLANMSHEIRTPLNAILGFSDMLTENSELSREVKEEYSSIINRNADNLLQIIDDILDISKLETGQVKIIKKTFDPLRTLNELFIQYQRKIAGSGKKDIVLKLKIPDCPVSIHTDKVRFNQIVSNLLSNSSKFTHYGEIEFGVMEISEQQITFFVSDTGIGIEKAVQSAIFERFRQATDSTTRLYGGTGLGLAIVKNLIELMGGEIYLESEIGKGTIFKFWLPIK